MRSILVPLDGSEISERALPYAEAIARAMEATLILMRAITTLPARAPGAAEFNLNLRTDAHEYLKAVLQTTATHGFQSKPVIVEDEAAYAILDVARSEAPEMIVMSTHGRTALGRAVWGSVADRVLRSSPVPVLLVPSRLPSMAATAEPAPLVLPLDGSIESEVAIEPAANLAAAFHAQVILVRAVEALPLIAGPDAWTVYAAYATNVDEEKEAAGRYLTAVAMRLNDRGTQASVVVEEGSARDVIPRVARAHHAQAIVMGTHGRGGATRLIMGSTADAVIHAAIAPTLLVRGPATTAAPASSNAQTEARLETLSVGPKELAVLDGALREWIQGNHGGEGLIEAFDLMSRVQALERRNSHSEPRTGSDRPAA